MRRSGTLIYNNNLNRRKFIQQSATIATLPGILQQCTVAADHVITGRIIGANSSVGHLLKEASVSNDTISETITTHTIIIGGGVSGLSAARWLQKNAHENFLLLELDKETGGNAAAGKNEVSSYPWGAHYVPLPNNNLTEYLAFLQESNVITGYENNQPIINDYYLCFEPQERLYINGYWQEGIIPHFGLPPEELEQIKKFMAVMDIFRKAKGRDNKDAFAIPVDESSNDEEFISLDAITMKDWMTKNNYSSPYLHWYINYCCRDDFGTDYSSTSAWAGIHYFAGRKGTAANAPQQSVITWPEGNHWLVKQLRKDIEKKILTNHIAIGVKNNENEVEVLVIDVASKKTKRIISKKCIIATPQFITARLMNDASRQKMVTENFNYQPWMVANITTEKLDEREGAVLSWDNVLYKGRGLGYVEATHQQINQLKTKNVLSYYLPLTEGTAKDERTIAQKRSFEDWVQIIKDDLSAAHSNFNQKVKNIDVWVWGHGMISPQINFVHGDIKKQMQQPIDDKIFFAHTDLSGISIFEEAFYQGIKAAKAILQMV